MTSDRRRRTVFISKTDGGKPEGSGQDRKTLMLTQGDAGLSIEPNPEDLTVQAQRTKV